MSTPSIEARDRRKRARGARLALALVALAAVAADQVLARVLLADGHFLGRRVAPFDPPLFNREQRQAFERLRALVERGPEVSDSIWYDPELGWTAPREREFLDGRFDWAGARMGRHELARERAAGVRRIAALGCSFTYGAEVEGEEAWPARLQELRADVELANLGMGGFGLDQALLRYLHEARALGADEVWLGLLPAAVQRILTVHTPVQRHWGPMVHFKPRFVLLPSGALELVPNPGSSLEQSLHLLTHQADYFAVVSAHDSFVRQNLAAYAPAGSRLCHHSGFARLLLTALESRTADAHAAWLDPQSETRLLVAALCRRMRAEVEAEGARFRLLILPGERDLLDRHRRGSGCWEPMMQELTREGMEIVDLAPALPGPDDPDWGRLWAPGGHYTDFGNQLVARELATRL